MRSPPLVLCAGALAVLCGLGLAVYPERRTVTWLEVLTDGLLPASFANQAQDVLASMWRDGFGKGAVQTGQQVTRALEEYLDHQPCQVVTELAAGGGLAPVMWVAALRNRTRPTLRLLLTDLQPNQRAWQALQTAHGQFVEYAPEPVDATNLSASHGGCAGGLRMIHLALHHFPQPLVKSLLADVVSDGAGLMIADLAPTRGGLLYNFMLALKYIPPVQEVYSHLMSLTLAERVWHMLFLPLMPFIAWHDATVSVLRAYSTEQLAQITRSVPGGDGYGLEVFESGSYGEWLGLPTALHVAGMADPVVSYTLITPRL